MGKDEKQPVKHKTKLFKKMFLNHSDCYAEQDPRDDAVPAMTEDTFVPLLGQMWSKAKAKYRKRNERDAIAFSKYMVALVILDEPINDWEKIYNDWKYGDKQDEIICVPSRLHNVDKQGHTVESNLKLKHIKLSKDET